MGDRDRDRDRIEIENEKTEVVSPFDVTFSVLTEFLIDAWLFERIFLATRTLSRSSHSRNIDATANTSLTQIAHFPLLHLICGV